MFRTKLNFKSIKSAKLFRSSINRPECNSYRCLQTDHFYITTPIFYVNSKPHLGHLYTLVVADACFRYEKLLENHKSYVFAAGTDEHGLKIQEAANNASMDCKKFCDLNSKLFRQLCEQFSISNTHFIRTTDDEHKKVVHKVWNELDKRNFIYKTDYVGWYSISDETFVPNKQIKTIDEFRNDLNELASQCKTSSISSDDQTEKDDDEIKNPNELLKFLNLQLAKTKKSENDLRVDYKTGNLLELSQEFNYIFKLEKVKDRLIDLIKSKENFITPDHFRNKLLNMIESDSLKDVSISRSKTRFNWGIPVPNDDEQIVYVWFDALCNYLTVANYSSDDFHWPPSVQVLGKDIIKFHGLYWPAFLFALDLEVPKKLNCHAHWMVNDLKMSKSKGNVVNPFDYLEAFRADGLRYFLLKAGVPHNDGNFSDKKLREYVNADLADTLGNLLQRSTNPKLNAKQSVPFVNLTDLNGELDETSNELIQQLNDLPDKVNKFYKNGHFYLGIDETMSVLHKCNKLFFEQEPWKLVKSSADEDKRRLNMLLYLTYETLRISSILLSPIIPNSSKIVFDKLNIAEGERYWKDCKLKVYKDENKFSQDKLIVYQKVQ